MRSKKKTKTSLAVKIFRFFFPKDFAGELRKGIEMGKMSNVSRELGGKIYDLGKWTRGKVDPEHKMKMGKHKDEAKGN